MMQSPPPPPEPSSSSHSPRGVTVCGPPSSGKSCLLIALTRDGLTYTDRETSYRFILRESNYDSYRYRPLPSAANTQAVLELIVDKSGGGGYRVQMPLIDTPGAFSRPDAIRSNDTGWQGVYAAISNSYGVVVVLDIANAVYARRHNGRKDDETASYLSTLLMHVMREASATRQGKKVLFCISKVDGQDDEVNVLIAEIGRWWQDVVFADLPDRTTLSELEEPFNIDNVIGRIVRLNRRWSEVPGSGTIAKRDWEADRFQRMTLREFREFFQRVEESSADVLPRKEMLRFFAEAPPQDLTTAVKQSLPATYNIMFAASNINTVQPAVENGLPIIAASAIGKGNNLGGDTVNIEQLASFIYRTIEDARNTPKRR
jgi:GTPase SAR1 family protein